MLDLEGIDVKLNSMNSPYKSYQNEPNSSNVIGNVNQIGQGTFGKVYKSQYMTKDNTVIVVALKKILLSKENEGFPRTALKEIKFLKKLQHKNILNLIDIVSTKTKQKTKVYLVFEYMAHDFSGLVDAKISFTQPEVKCLMHQVLTGINYLHMNNIIHRDIKSANVLLSNEGEVKIGDFGLAREHNPNPNIQRAYTNQVVTIWYRAPELLLGEVNYGTGIDMWSVGCLFVELIIGQPPFKGLNEKAQLETIFKVCGTPQIDECLSNPLLFKYPELIPKTRYDNSLRLYIDKELSLLNKPLIDDCTYDLLNKMLQVNPSRRLTAEEALSHEYFTFHLPPMCQPNQIQKIQKDAHSFQFRQGYKEMIAKAREKKSKAGNHPYKNPYYYSKDAEQKGKIIEKNVNDFNDELNFDFAPDEDKNNPRNTSPNRLQSLLFNK